jgi:hypothetical protein
MALLTAFARKKIPTSQFALSGQRKYPIEDKAHARNAISRAAQQRNAGNLSSAQAATIIAKARRKLGK